MSVRTLYLAGSPHRSQDRNDDQERGACSFRECGCALPFIRQKFAELLLNIHGEFIVRFG